MTVRIRVQNLNQLFIKCDFLITSLPSVSSYNQLLKSILSFSKFDKQKIIIDMNTISIKEKKNFKNKINNINIKVLDCPVSGGVIGAINKDMSIMVGGNESTYKKIKPVLDAMGDKAIYCGPVGSGTICKLSHQLFSGLCQTFRC